MVILLAVLAAIGIWSSIFLASRTPDTAVAAAPEAVAPAEAPGAGGRQAGARPPATEAAAVEVQAPAALPAPETATAPVTAEGAPGRRRATETETAAAAPTAPERWTHNPRRRPDRSRRP